MNLNEIVNISITMESQAVSQQGFGTLNILGDSMKLPRVDSVVLTFSADLVTSNVINMDVNGVALAPITFSTSNDITMGLIATALAALPEIDTAVVSGTAPNKHVITATSVYGSAVVIDNVVVTAGASQATCTVVRTAAERIHFYASLTEVAADFAVTDPEYLAAAAAFGQTPRSVLVAISRKDTTVPETWVEALNATVLVSDDWYGLVVTTRTKSDVELVAAWAETHTKLFFTASADGNILSSGSTTDVAAELQALDYDRSSCIYHPDADETTADPWPDAALAAKLLTVQKPGSATMMFKSLAGVPVTTLNTTQSLGARNKNCNTYELTGGVNMVAEGQVASGKYLDEMHGTDWLQARITEGVFFRLANLPKIPYTDAGVAVITAEIKKVIEQGIANDFLAINTDPAWHGGLPYYVSAPLVANVAAVDRANRLLPDITFAVKEAGAIHFVEIDGIVAV
jgi:hypothetical protein